MNKKYFELYHVVEKVIQTATAIAGVLFFTLVIAGINKGLFKEEKAIANPKPAEIIAQSANSEQSNEIADKLYQVWEGTDANGSRLLFFFNPNGKLFLLDPLSDPPQPFWVLEYQINTTAQPMQIDFKDRYGQILLTIFEFTPEGNLRWQLQDVYPGQFRPQEFTSSAYLFKPLSDPRIDIETLMKEGENMEILTLQQSEAENYIGAMNRAQQAHFIERQRFAIKLEDLGIGVPPETDSYRYEIVVGEDDRSVMMTATAKQPNLSSYTGAVFTFTTDDGSEMTIAEICKGNQPSTSPPIMPIRPNTSDNMRIECPPGSTAIAR